MAVAPASFSGVNYVAREARFPRLVALIIDSVIVSVITFVATNVYGVTVVTWGSPIPTNGFATWGAETTIPGIWAAAIWLVYYTVCEAMFGATPGKALNGLTVVSADGRPLSVIRIAVRNLLRLVDVLPGAYLLGGLFVLSNANSQRIGDLAARTTVVLRRRVIEEQMMRSSGRAARIVLVAAVAAVVVFTGLFDYFGEYNQHQLLGTHIVSYTLGNPSRTLTTVTYPISARTATDSCMGSVSLYWQGLFGWQLSGGNLACAPS